MNTIGGLYGPCAKVRTRVEARNHFKRLVRIHIEQFNRHPRQAIMREKISVGYYAGYYEPETRDRIMKLFLAEHPLFPRIRRYS